MPKVTITVPKSVMELPAEDRDAIMGVLAKAVRLPAVMPTYHPVTEDDNDMWAPDGDHFMASTEDELYSILNDWNMEMMADVFTALELPQEEVDLLKSFEGEQIMKSKNNGKSRMSDLINAGKEKRERFVQYMQEMNPFTKAQLKKLDTIMKRKLPDYAKVAEDFMVRAGFIGKIRNTAEQEMFETMGAIIDRFPSTIVAAKQKGVVLTAREKAESRRTVTVLPLSPQEARAVQHAATHAAEKMTEVSERHRAGVRQTVVRAQKERKTPQKLAQELFDQYGDQNRDWRRVAITELATSAGDAYLAGCEEGATVIGMGAENACKHCKTLLIGKEFTVTHELPKNTYTHEMNFVWSGKSNYGRRVAEYIPCTPMHPHCRCRYHRISRFYKMSDEGKAVLKSTAELIQEERARRGLPPDPNLM